MAAYNITTLNIDLRSVKQNYNLLKKFVASSEIAGVLKANSYGIGAGRISKILKSCGCNKFFVFSLDEAISLRKILSDNNSSIYVFQGAFFDEEVRFYIEYNLSPVLNNIHQLKLWLKHTHKLKAILHIDTGLNRFGMPDYEVQELVTNEDLLKNLNIEYIISHLACSDEKDKEFNERQLDVFQKTLTLFPNVKASLASSSGIFLGKNYHFDMVRPGAALYGINPTPYMHKNPMNQVVSLTSRLIQINKVLKASYIGYNCTELVPSNTVIGTVPIGYADGYSRSLSSKGYMYVGSYQVKVLGRVSMDLVNIDLTSVPEEFQRIGQEVEIIGPNIPIDTIARIANISSYEFLSLLGNRFKINYIG